MDENSSTSWKLFAGVMILIVGAMNIFDGLVAVTNANYLKDVAGGSGGHLPVTDNLKTWGWVVLVWGVILIVAGLLIFMGNIFGRLIGVVVAGLNALLQLAFLPHYPFWSFTMILIDVLVIYALVAHGGGGVRDDWSANSTT
jgi:hypothetical protein